MKTHNHTYVWFFSRSYDMCDRSAFCCSNHLRNGISSLVIKKNIVLQTKAEKEFCWFFSFCSIQTHRNFIFLKLAREIKSKFFIQLDFNYVENLNNIRVFLSQFVVIYNYNNKQL